MYVKGDIKLDSNQKFKIEVNYFKMDAAKFE